MLDTTIVLTGILSLLIYLFVKYQSKQNGSPPPGPRGYPIVGNTFQLDGTKMHLSLSKLANKYGDIYSLKIFGMKTVVLNSPEIVREALLKEPNASIFASRVETYFGKHFLFNYADLVSSSYTEAWAKRRKFSHKLLKAYGEGLKGIEKRLHGKLNSFIDDVRKYNGLVFDPEEMITDFLISIITGLLTGEDYGRHHVFSRAILEYDEVLNEILNRQVGLVMDYFPFLRYVPGKYKDVNDRCWEKQNRFFELIRKEKDHCEGGMIQDLYQALSNTDGSENNDWITEEIILAILSNMVGAGILTSKGALWSMVRILMSRPDVQHMMQDEVDRVVGHDRLPSLSDKSGMPYTEAVIFETLRFISHVPTSAPHVNSEDAKLGGYHIEKGSMILINVWNIHRNGKVFKEPLKFCPERFLGDGSHILPADSPIRQSFLAFGIGKRACIGEIFARNRIFLFLASMMQNFTFESEDGKIPLMLDPQEMVQNAVNMPQRYKCKAVERSC